MISSHDVAGSEAYTSVATDEIVPALRWDIRVRTENGNAVLEDDDSEIQLEDVSTEALLRVLALLDGRRTVSAIVDETGLDSELVSSIVEALSGVGWVVDFNAKSNEDLSPENFAVICRRLFPIWKSKLFGHPLWELLRTGQASASQFAGWLFEQYHFIDGVNDRLALVVAECTDLRIRPIFARHFTEEYNHSHFFLKSLRALGYDTALTQATRPLPSTLAVLNHMRHCARQGPLEYAVCSGFLESTGADRQKGMGFFDMLEKNYAPDKPGVIKPMVDHLRLDEAYGHNELMESVCQLLGPIPVERASKALAGGALFVEMLGLWSTDMLKTYSAADSVPRLNPYRYRPASFD